jgi:hypothetical protein
MIDTHLITLRDDLLNLRMLCVNNVEMIDLVKDNTLEYVISEKVVSVDVKFTKIEIPTYDVTYEDLGGKGSYELKQTSVKAGEKLTVTINPSEGFVPDKVTFNGEEMTKVSTNTYEIVVQASGTVRVTFATVEPENPTGSPTSSNNAGCSGSLGLGMGGLTVLMGLSLAHLKRKK